MRRVRRVLFVQERTDVHLRGIRTVVLGLRAHPLGARGRLVEDLHGVGGSLGQVAREALFWLIPIPLLKGVSLLYSGVLIRARRTGVVSYATFASIGASVLAVLLLLPADFVRAHPIWLPILVTYAGLFSELAVTLWGSWRHTRHLRGEGGSQFSFLYVVRFFWPLALIMVIQGLSRPLINLFVAREPGGAEALAVLTVLYSLALLPYAWVNEVRNLPPAYQDRKGNLGHIRRFTLGCGLVSFGLMVVLFWTPLREFILNTLLGIEQELVGLAAMPLIHSVFFPRTVMVRAYHHGIGLVEHRTRALATSALARILGLLSALLILPVFGIHGATRGMAALLFSFFIEALAVWWAIGGRATGLRGTKHLVDRVH